MREFDRTSLSVNYSVMKQESSSRQPSPFSEASVQQGVLTNGLRIITDTVPFVKSVTLGIQIDAGSRDDPKESPGLAHFIEHAIFKGHFPGNPVTPGVVQLEILGEVLSDVLDQKVSLKTMGNCKFLAILNPEVNNEIEVKITHSLTEENTYKVAAQFGAEGITFTKIQAEFN
jgi:3-hydroxyacyl-[acyl-carrier-protein] dehydratase